MQLELFSGPDLPPTVALPTPDYLRRACGEWQVYCRGIGGFDALMPASWQPTQDSYSA